ncbi:MAG: peptidase M28, partial [Acidobacteriota bacterium]
MRKTPVLCTLIALTVFSLFGCTKDEQPAQPQPAQPSSSKPGEGGQPAELHDAREESLANIRQLTFGGENAEAYWSSDGQKLIFQSTSGEHKCDQIFTMNLDGSERKLVSTGKGRTTCSYFFPDGKRILFSSTHSSNPECPPPPDYSQGYVWQINKDYDIYTANPDGSDLKPLSNTPGYDAEATISPDGKKIVFTSMRDGDLDIYVMNADGSNVKRLTKTPGYDGGAFFSPDGKMIVYRAQRPETEADLKDYQELLKKGLVRPTKLEIFIMNADGSEQRQLTSTGKANFCPYFHPNGRTIIFASNFEAV